MSKTASIFFKGQTIHYHQYGQGGEIMLAFHGFGQQGSDLFPVSKALGNMYTIYSFDLFYHGKSYWSNGDQVMGKDFWKDFIQEFSNRHSIDRFSVCGFSLGGKFALSTLEAYPERVESLFLLAPDGIKTSMWYSLATYPILFKDYFKSMIVKPHRFFDLLNFLKKLGWVEKGISKFAASQMNTIKKRRRVYYSWVVFKALTFKLKKIAALINKHHIKVYMYLGRHDKIITEKGMRKLLKHVYDYQLYIIESGHNRLVEKTAEFMSEAGA